jgi:hypothetical protein
MHPEGLIGEPKQTTSAQFFQSFLGSPWPGEYATHPLPGGSGAGPVFPVPGGANAVPIARPFGFISHVPSVP